MAKIRSITVSYSQTQSLPQYSNVKPGITISADLEEGDIVPDCVADLFVQARGFVQVEIDESLREAGLPPKYSNEDSEDEEDKPF